MFNPIDNPFAPNNMIGTGSGRTFKLTDFKQVTADE